VRGEDGRRPEIRLRADRAERQGRLRSERHKPDGLGQASFRLQNDRRSALGRIKSFEKTAIRSLTSSTARRSILMPMRGPACIAVFAQVHSAGHLISVERAGELIRQPLPLNPVRAAEVYLIGGDGAVEITRNEFALMRAD